MSSPDPDFWKWLVGSLTSASMGLFGYHKYLDGKFSKKANKDDVTDIKQELSVQRDHIAKIYDKLGEAEGKNEERHRELLMHLLEKRER